MGLAGLAGLVLLMGLLSLLMGGIHESLAAPSGPFLFTRTPYIQGLSSRGVVIRWEGNAPVGGTLSVEGPDGFSITRDTTDVKAEFHSVDVDGLQPSTSYRYRVTSSGVTSGDGAFTTAPSDSRPFTFLLYGDNRTNHAAHASVVTLMARTPGDFLVHTGDMVETGASIGDWDKFFQIESPLLRDRCLFACVGNHELMTGGAAMFLRYFQPGMPGKEPNLYGSVRWSNARFFFLNAMASYELSSKDHLWLEDALSHSKDEPGLVHRFVVMHHSPYSSGPHGNNTAILAGKTLEMLKAYKVIVLAGHDHVYERGELDGLKYLVSGGGGAPLYKPRLPLNPATLALESVHHFVEVKVDGASISTTARRADGSLLESCALSVDRPWACEGKPTMLRAAPSPPKSTSTSPDPKPIAVDPLEEPAKAPSHGCGCELVGSTQANPGGFYVVLVVLGLRNLTHRRPRRRTAERPHPPSPSPPQKDAAARGCLGGECGHSGSATCVRWEAAPRCSRRPQERRHEHAAGTTLRAPDRGQREQRGAASSSAVATETFR